MSTAQVTAAVIMMPLPGRSALECPMGLPWTALWGGLAKAWPHRTSSKQRPRALPMTVATGGGAQLWEALSNAEAEQASLLGGIQLWVAAPELWRSARSDRVADRLRWQLAGRQRSSLKPTYTVQPSFLTSRLSLRSRRGDEPWDDTPVEHAVEGTVVEVLRSRDLALSHCHFEADSSLKPTVTPSTPRLT